MKDAVWDCSYGCYIYFQIRFNFVDSTIAIHIKRTLVVLAQNGLPDSERDLHTCITCTHACISD